VTPRADRRSYDAVAIDRDGSSFVVLLGGRPLRTPEKSILRLPTAALAAGVANEWLAQGAMLRPETMPLTRLAATAAERMGGRRRAVVKVVVGYAGSDLLCYRAASPDELVAKQRSAWQPLLDWAAERWGARLAVVAGVVPIEQPQPAIDALRRAVNQASDVELAALSCVVQASGSIVVGLALLDGHIDAATASATALLDEQYQAERWGIDAEAERRRRDIADDIRAAASFLALGRPARLATAVSLGADEIGR
jgi:chaperone required for assembly of F1-ATPase